MSLFLSCENIKKEIRSKIDLILKTIRKEFAFIIVMPAVVWQVIFCLIPVFYILLFSFLPKTTAGFFGFLQNYIEILKPHYMSCLKNSVILSFVSTLGCLFFCFPMAYILAFKIKKGREFFLSALMLPWWTNSIIRIYCWFFLLDKKSILFKLLKGAIDITSSTQLIFNPLTIVLGTIYCYFAFMLLPLYNKMISIPRNYVETSADLGASEFQTVLRIIIPLCKAEIIWYSIFIGFCAFGEFAIPELFGGAKYGFWASVISNKFVLLKDFHIGASYTVFGMLVFSLFAFFVSQLFKLTGQNSKW